MILELPFFLDENSNKRVAFETIALIRKIPSKSSEKLKKKPYMFQLVKNLSNSMRK